MLFRSLIDSFVPASAVSALMGTAPSAASSASTATSSIGVGTTAASTIGAGTAAALAASGALADDPAVKESKKEKACRSCKKQGACCLLIDGIQSIQAGALMLGIQPEIDQKKLKKYKKCVPFCEKACIELHKCPYLNI